MELLLIDVGVKEGLGLWWVKLKGPQDLWEWLMGSSSADIPAWPPLFVSAVWTGQGTLLYMLTLWPLGQAFIASVFLICSD